MNMRRNLAATKCLLAIVLAGSASLAEAQEAQHESAQAPAQLQDFAGTWHWMAKGQTFATMKLEMHDGQLTGTLTNSTFDVDEQGRPADAMARPGTTTIVRSALEEGVLHLWGKDGSDETEWKMRMVDADTADLVPMGPGAPSLKQGIRAERVK